MRWPRAWSRPRRDKQHDALVRSLRTAVAGRDAGAARMLLHPEVLAVIDSGHEQPPMRGSAAVASMLLAALGEPTVASVNGRAGLVAGGGAPPAVVSVSVVRGLIVRVWLTSDPRKLSQWM